MKLPEIKCLMHLNHPNLVQLIELIKHNNELYFIFEFMSQNIYQLIKDQNPLSEIAIRNVLF